MVPGARARFGGLGKLPTVASMIESRRPVAVEVGFHESDDQVIRKTFERMRDGLAVDRFLADPALARKFAQQCVDLGIKRSHADINRRLLKMRKASGGGLLAPTSNSPKHRGLADRFGFGVESAIVKLHLRHGASVDDVLADVELGEVFEKTARRLSPGGRPVEYRVCALQLRKRRHLTPQMRSLFDNMDPTEAQHSFVEFSHRRGVSAASELRVPGLILLSEAETPLFLGRFSRLSTGLDRLGDERVVSKLAEDSFTWKPNMKSVRVEYAVASSLRAGNLQAWELRLIQAWRPAFNLPIKSVA